MTLAPFRNLALAVLTVAMALAFVAMPFRVTVKGWRAELALHSAFAKDGNGKGVGNGNGNGKDKGGGQGEGNDKGGGKDKGANGKSDGNAKGGGASGKGSTGRAAGRNAASAAENQINPSTGDMVQVSGTDIDVLHRNGMRERVKAGRYLMKDGKGRTIIERPATGADIRRLRGMAD